MKNKKKQPQTTHLEISARGQSRLSRESIFFRAPFFGTLPIHIAHNNVDAAKTKMDLYDRISKKTPI